MDLGFEPGLFLCQFFLLSFLTPLAGLDLLLEVGRIIFCFFELAVIIGLSQLLEVVGRSSRLKNRLLSNILHGRHARRASVVSLGIEHSAAGLRLLQVRVGPVGLISVVRRILIVGLGPLELELRLKPLIRLVGVLRILLISWVVLLLVHIGPVL